MQEQEITRFEQHGRCGRIASLLIDSLKDGKMGDVKTDEELAKLCGANTAVGEKGYGYLMSAIRHCANNFNVVWQRMMGASAIKCLNTNEILEDSRADSAAINRRAKRSVQKLSCGDPRELDDAERREFFASISLVGSLALFSSTDTRKKLVARNVSEPLDKNRLLELMDSKT